MPQDNLQVNSQAPQDNPDETAAVLSFVTKLSEGLLPKISPQPQETGSTSDVEQKDGVSIAKENKFDLEANNKETESKPVSKEKNEKKEHGKEIEKLTKGFGEFKDEIKDIIKSKFDNLSKIIKNAIEEE